MERWNETRKQQYPENETSSLTAAFIVRSDHALARMRPGVPACERVICRHGCWAHSNVSVFDQCVQGSPVVTRIYQKYAQHGKRYKKRVGLIRE